MKESESIELKRSLAELKDGLNSIAAILNKHGAGELWLGVRSDGAAVGLEVTEKTLHDLSQTIAAHIEPKIFPHITTEIVSGKTCVKVAFSGKETPYFAYGRAYMRVADEDRHLTAKELENLILARNREALRWDNQPCKSTVKDLSERKMRAFVKRAGLAWDKSANVLEKLGLLQNGQLLNAAPLFFAKEPELQLRYAVFATTDSATIIDRHDFTGDILELIEEAQKYILKNIHIGMKLEGLYRVDVPEISVAAMREAIINAFCHRDYRDPDYVQVAILKDRVEIRNPGELYGGLTIARIRKGNVSRRRNPLVAELMRRIQMVETWGRGMRLILAEEPTVQFEEVAQLFITSFIYLAKQLSTERVARFFALQESGSTRYGLPVSAIESVEIPTPPKPEQTKIAEILSTVDRVIEQTEALIAKQQRIKAGLMQDLLTCGIDEHGNLRSEETHKFKDSPLGRIPVEWAIKSLNDCVMPDAPICYGILMP